MVTAAMISGTEAGVGSLSPIGVPGMLLSPIALAMTVTMVWSARKNTRPPRPMTLPTRSSVPISERERQRRRIVHERLQDGDQDRRQRERRDERDEQADLRRNVVLE